MNRRSFIAALASAMLTAPVPALAFDDTRVALDMARRIILVAARYRSAPLTMVDGSRNPAKDADYALMTSMTDELIGFMLDRFPAGATLEEVQAIFRSPEALDVSRLRVEAIPVSIIRDLIGRHGVILDIHRMTHWTAYVSRYRAVVMPTALAA